MFTKTQVMTYILEDSGTILGNNHITYSLTDISNELDITTNPPNPNTALKWQAELQKWVPGTLIGMELHGYMYQEDVDAKIQEVLGAAPSQADSLGELTAYFGQDIALLQQFKDLEESATMKAFEGNGTQTLFDIEHTAGKVSVTVNGIEQIYNITDYSDTSGGLNMTTGFDFSSVDNTQTIVNSQSAATKIQFESTSIPAIGDNIEIRIY
tara:strand:+ start:7606 stop:8238 length:633 start_codon:yes stop_codon:yes gene_type:complete